MKSAESYKNLIETARSKAEQFHKDGLKTNQIRNFYSEIDKLRALYRKSEDNAEEIVGRLILLKPKLAYAAGRQRAVRKNFYPFMEKRIDEVVDANDKKEAIETFFTWIESIVGYHKFYGD
ncbi:MAG: type III-A CRISPR-associated protein Csm2 [Bacteroidota bacterium]